MPFYQEIPSQRVYQPIDILPTPVPTFRMVEGAQPDTISSDQAEHWAVDSFSRAPKISDLENEVMGDVPLSTKSAHRVLSRSEHREEIQKTATEYKNLFNLRASQSIHSSSVREGTRVITEALTLTHLTAKLAWRPPPAEIRMRSEIVLSSRTNRPKLEFQTNIGRSELQSKCEKKADELLNMILHYPDWAARHRTIRQSMAAPHLRNLLGETGLSEYEEACTSSDVAVPPYLEELAKMNAPNIVEQRYQSDPTSDLLPDRRFDEAARLTDLTECAKQLLAPTVREFSYLAMANNQVEASSSRSHVG